MPQEHTAAMNHHLELVADLATARVRAEVVADAASGRVGGHPPATEHVQRGLREAADSARRALEDATWVLGRARLWTQQGLDPDVAVIAAVLSER